MQQKNIGIRRAGTGDASQMVAISQGGATGPASRIVMDRWLEMPGVFSYVAEDERLFGFITVGPDLMVGQDRNQGQVLAWAIQTDYRQRGMGRKLLVHGLSVLKRRMFERAVIWLPEEAERTRKIVGKLEFEATGAQRWDNEVTESQGSRSLSYLCYRRDLEDFF